MSVLYPLIQALVLLPLRRCSRYNPRGARPLA